MWIEQRAQRGLVSVLGVALLLTGCDRDRSPEGPSRPTSVVITSTTPSPGSTLMPSGTPPGTFFTRGSGQFGVSVTVTSGQDLPFAQLAMFLVTADESGYCGQNLPDWPTWRPFPRGESVSLTVTGFQVFRLPCEVTGVRAVFNTREDLHLGGVPPANQIVADVTFPVVYHLR